MPRAARLDAPGVLQHVMARGIERRDVFRDDRDRAAFVERLGDALGSTGATCFAWALMPNHVHLLLSSGGKRIGSLMLRLLGPYATYFNRRHRRHGHLFQNRYRSIVCQEDRYLLELVRYIHLNPVRAGIVKSPARLDRYRWTGHAVLMGEREAAWQDRDAVLAMFDERPAAARRAYRAFVVEGWDQGSRPELVGGGLRRSHGGTQGVLRALRDEGEVWSDERVLGDSHFVRETLDEADAVATARRKARRAGWTPRAVIQHAAKVAGVSADAVKGGSKAAPVCHARRLACYWLIETLGLRPVEVAKLLELDATAAARSAERSRERDDPGALPGRQASAK